MASIIPECYSDALIRTMASYAARATAAGITGRLVRDESIFGYKVIKPEGFGALSAQTPAMLGPMYPNKMIALAPKAEATVSTNLTVSGEATFDPPGVEGVMEAGTSGKREPDWFKNRHISMAEFREKYGK